VTATERRRGDGTRENLQQLLEDDPVDLFENAPCGYLSTLPDGTIVKINRTLCSWLGRNADEVLRTRLRDLLSVGGQVFHDTHLAPLLRMQGVVREVALDVVRADGSLLPCLVNAVEVRTDDGAPLLVRATLFEATARRRYEREILEAHRLAEASQARSRVLQQFTAELAAAVTVSDAAAMVVHRSRRAAGAAGAGLWLGDPDPARRTPTAGVALTASEGMPDAVLAVLAGVSSTRMELLLGAGVSTVPVGEALHAAEPALAGAL
jgi:PAS domain S-box-containing protein